MRVATYHLRGVPTIPPKGTGPRHRKCEKCGALPGNACWTERGLYPRKMKNFHDGR